MKPAAIEMWMRYTTLVDLAVGQAARPDCSRF